MQACVAQGESSAQTEFNAYIACQNSAAQGSCQADCTPATDPKCLPCVDAACKTEKEACLGAAPAAVTGYGAKCDNTIPCAATLKCVGAQGAPSGFCSLDCVNNQCPEGPAGTASECIFVTQAGSTTPDLCGFVCTTPTGSFSCPPDLKCGTANASGYAACE